MSSASNDGTRWPSVSVVMPVRNEAAGLRHAVESVLNQVYDGPLDVWVALAPSEDTTAGVLDELIRDHPRVHRVDNPVGTTPAGLNAAISASDGEVVVRVDGHARLPQGYVATAVATMLRTGAANVGGRQHAVGQTAFEQAVAAVTNSWVGSGGPRYRAGGAEGPVDTVYLGVFRRSAGDAVGWFDEALLRNQDYEFNLRLRESGETVWFDPYLVVDYRPRSTFRGLARQYFDYGRFKAKVLLSNPRSVRMRQLVPAAVAPMTVICLAAVFFTRLAIAPLLGYVAVLGFATRRAGSWHAVPVAATIHLAWSAGLWIGPHRRVVASR